MKRINENIKELRAEQNLSQKQLADIIGKTVSQISNYERGTVDVPASVIYDIAEKTGADLMFLMTGQKPEAHSGQKYDAQFRVYSASDRNIIVPILVANGYDVGQHKEQRTPTGKTVDYYIHIRENPDNINTAR